MLFVFNTAIAHNIFFFRIELLTYLAVNKLLFIYFFVS